MRQNPPTQRRPASVQAVQSPAPASAPTTPAQQVSAPKDRVTLTGIVQGVGQPYAVINGAIVSEGERVGTAVLIEITKNAVRLRRDDGTDLVLTVPR